MRLGMEAVSLMFFVACAVMPATALSEMEIGGQKIVKLTRKPTSTTEPEFTSITVLPGRGMEILQITAHFPGKGEVNVLASPDEATAKKMLDEQDTANGDLGYRIGSALLFPYPNRIIGPLSADGKTLTTEWHGKKLSIPANNIGAAPGSIRHALHGLILKSKTDDVKVTKIEGGEKVTGTIHGGNFNGQWFSDSDLEVTFTLTAHAVDATIVAKNVGKTAEPVAIGWHPYFNIPSGDRTQVKIHIPAEEVAVVDNYDNVFPTGELKPVSGQYDLRAPGGVALAKNFYDDNWSKLDWSKGTATVKVVDQAAHYGIAIEGISPEIKTIQMYAPPTKEFVAIEHQFNFADPFGKEWKGMDTGMVTLEPGQSTKWHVRLKVFVPGESSK